MNKSIIKNAPNPTSSGSGEGKHDLIDRQAAIDTAIEAADEWDGGTNFSRDGIIERRLKMIPAVHVADIGKKVDGDCISRQAVVKFFNDWISCLDENCHHQSVADMIIIKNDFKNLPSVQPESKWIPVSERLPDEGQKCLVSDKGAIGIDTYMVMGTRTTGNGT